MAQLIEDALTQMECTFESISAQTNNSLITNQFERLSDLQLWRALDFCEGW